MTWRPDWRDARAYPNVARDLSTAQWRWQFLRRREDYAQAWRDWPATALRPVDAGERGPTRTVRLKQAAGTVEAFGTEWLCDPSEPWAPSEATGRQTVLAPFALNMDELERAKRNGYAVLMVDLHQTDADILDSVRRMTAALRDLHGINHEGRQRRDRWPLFLRVLDAEAAGATPEEIAEALGHGDAKKARDDLVAAHEVMRAANTPRL